MHIKTHENSQTLTLKFQGPFNFDAIREFNQVISDLKSDQEHFENIDVDLSATHCIDSSALGMLMILQDDMKHVGKTLKLTNCPETLKHILMQVHLHEKFLVD